MKVGDILINRWAGHIDCRYFIYLGTDGKFINGLYYNERFKKVKYFKEDLDKMIDDKKVFEVVGHTNFLNIAKADLQKIKDLEEKQC